ASRRHRSHRQRRHQPALGAGRGSGGHLDRRDRAATAGLGEPEDDLGDGRRPDRRARRHLQRSGCRRAPRLGDPALPRAGADARDQRRRVAPRLRGGCARRRPDARPRLVGRGLLPRSQGLARRRELADRRHTHVLLFPAQGGSRAHPRPGRARASGPASRAPAPRTHLQAPGRVGHSPPVRRAAPAVAVAAADADRRRAFASAAARSGGALARCRRRLPAGGDDGRSAGRLQRGRRAGARRRGARSTARCSPAADPRRPAAHRHGGVVQAAAASDTRRLARSRPRRPVAGLHPRAHRTGMGAAALGVRRAAGAARWPPRLGRVPHAAPRLGRRRAFAPARAADRSGRSPL
ncbi:MAG: NAD-dependent epimerase/dehydratase, partial [uncultured Solirubrobacteraceae bacterium]